MAQLTDSPLILFYPTSPVHVADLRLVIQHQPTWRILGIVYQPTAKLNPGIDIAFRQNNIEYLELGTDTAPETSLPTDANALVLGIAANQLSLDLLAWAKWKKIPVIAIEEVAQLALNHWDINNYDAPLDRFFVASSEEKNRFLKLGYPSEGLRVSGLLANDRLGKPEEVDDRKIRERIGLGYGEQAIVYTTSPLRNRLAINNKDDWSFRESVLQQINIASRRTGWRVLIKLHPNEDLETEKSRVQEIIPNSIVVGREWAINEIFTITGVLINRGNSQTCLDAVLRGIPTVISACGLKTLFHVDGGAYIVEKVSQLAEAVERAAIEGTADASQVRTKHFFSPPQGVADFIAEEIKAVIAVPQPANEQSWNWLIKSVLSVGRHDRALSICEQMTARTPWQDTVRLALKTHIDGRLQDSLAAWIECSALDPTWFFAHYELAHGYQASGEFHRAIEHAHKAIELHPPFHALWHEIPMRVVIMASFRNMGDVGSATDELNSLEARELVDIVPELLIERAAQLGALKGRLEDASDCLDNALAQLKTYPVNESADAQLRDRALTQVREIIERCERERTYPVAERLYLRILEAQPDDLWSKYSLARARLMQWKISQALRDLHSITRLPNGARNLMARIVSPVATDKLDWYWPATPKSILRPIKLATWVGVWAIEKVIRSGFNDIADAAAGSLLVALFVVRHFFRRLSSETVALRRTFRLLRAYLPWNSIYRYHQVKSCPICGARGKFEYQNKLTPLFRCSQCDHVYARQLPDDQVLGSLYGDVGYWEKDRLHQGITTMQESAQWEVYLKARLGILQRLDLLAPATSGSKSVFEIGCAEGMLLHALKKRGIRVAGCEMNRAVAAQGVKNLGVDIRTEPFENLELPEKNCDLVISFHTLEHMRFPVNVLAKIAEILRPGGSVLIEVPCGEEEYENTDHLHFFSETSLRLLLNKFFSSTEIIDNAYTNSAGVRIGSIYGVGRGVRHDDL